MNYPFILKISSVTNLSDARYAAGVWADYLGFCCDPSSLNYIDPNKIKEIKSWVNGPEIVLEFKSQPIEWIADFCNEIKPHAIQIPIENFNNNLLDLNLKIILEINSVCDIPEGNFTLASSNGDIAQQYKNKGYTVLYQPSNLSENIDAYNGIALEGQREDKPGTRDHGSWTDFLEPYMN